MDLNNSYIKANLEEESVPKFKFHECPFIPQNNLSYRKNFIDEHTYKYYHINFGDKLYSPNKDVMSINYSNEENKKQEQDINNTNNMHIYHNKLNSKCNNKKEKEINTETGSDDFPNRTHESGGNSTNNHGRGREKLLNPRKIISEVMKSKTQEDGKHSIQLNKEILSLDRKCFNTSNSCDISFADLNETFETHDENSEFTLSAKITIKTDITHQKFCEHEPRINKTMNCKHDSKSFQSKKSNHKPTTTNTVPNEKTSHAEFSHENENSIPRNTKKTIQDLGTLQEAEEMKRLLCEKGKSISKINDVYKEEQFLYDPESEKVSHSILTRSRSSNFLEYLNQINNISLKQSHLVPPNKLQLIRSGSLDTIQLSKSRNKNEKNKIFSPDKRRLTKTVSSVDTPSHSVQKLNEEFNPKEFVEPKNILIFENNLPSPSNVRLNHTKQIFPSVDEDCADQTKDETCDQSKSATLSSIHKRPELQKRYFYNEFKTYKRNTKDDICSDQVKSTKEKFEKIFCKLINKRISENYCSDEVNILKTQIPISGINIESLKSSQRFVSEDNICQNEKKSDINENILKNDTENGNEESNEIRTRTDGSQNSMVKTELTSPQQSRISMQHSKQQLFKLKHRTGSMDSLPTKDNLRNDYKMKANRNISKRETVISEDNVRENFFSINQVPNKIENYNGEENFENSNINDAELHFNEYNFATEKRTQNYNKHKARVPNQPEKCTRETRTKEILQDNHINNKLWKDHKSVQNKNEETMEAEDSKNSLEDCSNNKIIKNINQHDPDALESFGRPITEDVLRKIRECGTSITYFGGKVISRKYGPMCSPMTMTILNEIKQYMSVLNEHFHKPRDEGREI